MMMIETEMLRLEITYNYDVTKNDVFGSVAIGNCQTRFDMSHGFTKNGFSPFEKKLRK
jgi:hypothetical protein